MQEMHGLNWIDNLARFRTVSDGGGFTGVDPLAEKYYSISPYAWCGNNPVNAVDLDGMDYWSTSDPDEIKRFMNSVQNGTAYYNASNWTHITDKEFTSKLTYNDETFKFHTSYSYYDKSGELTCKGLTFTNTMKFINEKQSNLFEKWGKSDNLLAKYAYNSLNDLFVTLQPLAEPFIGSIRINELTGGKAFMNLDGSTNYRAIESAASTLSGVLPANNAVKGLSLNKMNAIQFSKTFKGSLSKLNASTRGFLNRRINNFVDIFNKKVPDGKIVQDGVSIGSEIKNE